MAGVPADGSVRRATAGYAGCAAVGAVEAVERGPRQRDSTRLHELPAGGQQARGDGDLDRVTDEEGDHAEREGRAQRAVGEAHQPRHAARRRSTRLPSAMVARGAGEVRSPPRWASQPTSAAAAMKPTM